jgi:hypothetical protein
MAITQLPEPPGPDESPAPEPVPARPDMSWTRDAVFAGLLIAGLFLLEGWLYVRTYYGAFHIPTEGLEVSPQELMFQGAHSLLFPLIVVPVAFLLRLYVRRMFLLCVVVITSFAVILAFVASSFRWYSAMDIIVQTAAVLWIGLAVLAVQRGFGQDDPRQRLMLVGAALLLVVSLPTAFGTIDAGQKAKVSRTHLVMVSTHELGVPDAVKVGNLFEYRKFVLLRETGTRYWLMRVGRAGDIFSVAKNEVLYVRY